MQADTAAGSARTSVAERNRPAELSVVIVAWNSGEDLLRCLQSLQTNPPSVEWEAIVVDNGSSDGSIERVRDELVKYEHPFFDFQARETKEGVQLLIRSKIPNVLSPQYTITLAERDLQSSQFTWSFQKLLYDCLTDYVVELFTKNPRT